MTVLGQSVGDYWQPRRWSSP